MMTSGKSYLSILNPLLAVGCLISAIVLYIHTSGSPQAYKAFEYMKEQIKTQISINLLKPDSFNSIGNAMVYVGSREGNELRNIFISYIPKKQTSNTNIISAKEGALLMENGEVHIQLVNGYRQELSATNEVIATLQFESLSYDITQFFKRFYEKSSKVNYLTQSELVREAKVATDEHLKTNYKAEYHSRILSSFLSILNALIVGIFLIKAKERGQMLRDSISAFFAGTGCYVFFMLLLNTATKNTAMIFYNYLIMLGSIAFLYVFFMRRQN